MIKGIHTTVTILRFLLFHEEAYREKVVKRAKPFAAVFLVLLGLDLWKLTPTGILQLKTQWELRIICMLSLLLLYVLSLIPLTRHSVKKWRDIPRLSSQDLERLNKYYEKQRTS